MSEQTVEIAESILTAEIVGWGESNMELVGNARSDIQDAMAILRELRSPHEIDTLRSHSDRLLGIALAKLKDAENRVDVCYNELDGEREDAELAS